MVTYTIGFLKINENKIVSLLDENRVFNSYDKVK